MDIYKIAFVFDDSLDKTDGVQQYILALGEWFARKGHEVHYITGETKRTDLQHLHSIGKNVRVRFNQNRMSIPLPVSRKNITELLAREEFDILHVQVPYSPWLAGRVIAAAGPQTGVVGTFHIAPHSKMVHAANTLLRFIASRSLSRFDEMLSVSEVAQTFAWETFGVESAIVPNTLRLEPFYLAKPFTEYRSSTNVVFFGRLVERKGCQYFLRAIKRLRDGRLLPANCRVLVCGSGPMETELTSYVHEHGLGKLVTFTGFVPEADKARYLASADLAVYPSTGGESFGIVLLEGMAACRGVVLAGNNPGYASVLGQRPEVLFDPTNEEQFAHKLQVYLDDPARRARRRDWQRLAVGKFDVPNVAEEVLVAYEAALRKRRG